ncbi:hypothetical protein DY000_02014210 [Brassica cretica]|uniref:Uncharacterized protein n=1 Tax=Brassica cretica TaxID=69181 RepID=A0ABQ7DA89_BRACR|nr:hypothetical protein DY000_02014210 [Brassica cretica]
MKTPCGFWKLTCSSSEKTKSEWVCTSFTTPSYLKSEDKYPELLGFKLEGIMSTSIAYLVRIGVSPRDIGPVVTQYPHLLGMRVGTMIKPLVDYLISIGIVARIGRETCLYRRDKMSTQHYFFTVKLKIDPEGFARIVEKMPRVVSLKHDKRFEERLECNFTDAFMPSK